jgi:hypothetical protein
MIMKKDCKELRKGDFYRYVKRVDTGFADFCVAR